MVVVIRSAQKAESNMNGYSEGSSAEGQTSTVADTHAETEVVALRRLEFEFEMQFEMQLEMHFFSSDSRQRAGVGRKKKFNAKARA